MLLFVTQIKLALDDTILNTPSTPRGEVQDKIMFIISETRTYTVAKQKKSTVLRMHKFRRLY